MANWLLSIITLATLVIRSIGANVDSPPETASVRAEVAGLELRVHGTNRGLSYFFVINEYLEEQLARQSYCWDIVYNVHAGKEIKCYSDPTFDMIRGDLTFAAMKEIEDRYPTPFIIAQEPAFLQRVEQPMSIYVTSPERLLREFSFEMRMRDGLESEELSVLPQEWIGYALGVAKFHRYLWFPIDRARRQIRMKS